MRPNLQVMDSAEAVYARAASKFVKIGGQAIADRGSFTVALSGGSTPRGMYRQLAKHHSKSIAWSCVTVYFSDERTVPPNHPQSNFRTANEGLIQHVPIRPDRVFRMHGELEPAVAAEMYQRTLAENFQMPFGYERPRIDLVMLGVGDDAHTASLFPHTAALDEKERWIVANEVTKLDTWRLTMTAPLINASRHVIILATGAPKAPALAAILERPWQPHEYPCQLIRPCQGELAWIVDREAAQSLESPSH